MDKFLEKSTQSFNSAEFLAKNNYYSSCVNRSYYSFFQFMMHILFEKLHQDKAAFDREAKDMGQGTHIKASNLMAKEIQKKDNQDFKWFQRNVPALRKQRVKADYHDIAISPSEAFTSITDATAIISVMKRHFK